MFGRNALNHAFALRACNEWEVSESGTKLPHSKGGCLMPDECRVQFLPDDKSVVVKTGTTILEAATQAGVFIDGICGGDGVCGRCRVAVRSGTATGGTTNHLTREEILDGYILACEGHIQSDLVVDVPAETSLADSELDADEVPELVDVAGQPGRQLPLVPLVRKSYLTLPLPNLDNNVSDLQFG